MAFDQPTTTSSLSTLLAPNLKAVFYEELSDYPEIFLKYLNQKGTKRAYEDHGKITGLGLLSELNEQQGIQYDGVDQYATKRVNQICIAGGFQVTKKMRIFDLYGIVEQMPRELARVLHQTKEIRCARIWNDAFTGTYHTMFDGLRLCHTAHTLKSGGTQSNQSATNVAFSPDNLEVAIMAVENQVNERGQTKVNEAKHVITKNDLRFAIKRALESNLQPDSLTNDMNVLKSEGISHIKVPYITSTTAWFVSVAIKRLKLFIYESFPPNPEQEGDFDTKNHKFSVDEWFEVAALDYFGLWGSPGV